MRNLQCIYDINYKIRGHVPTVSLKLSCRNKCHFKDQNFPINQKA